MNATLSSILQILEGTVPAVLDLLATQKHSVEPAAQAEHVANLTNSMSLIAHLKRDAYDFMGESTDAPDIRNLAAAAEPLMRVPLGEFQYVHTDKPQTDEATEPTEEGK